MKQKRENCGGSDVVVPFAFILVSSMQRFWNLVLVHVS